MPTLPIQNVRAADPGVKFEFNPQGIEGLDTTEPLNLIVTITETGSNDPNHVTNMVIRPPFIDEDHVVILPFGCSHYSEVTKVHLKVEAKQKGVLKGTWQTNPDILPYRNWVFLAKIRNVEDGRVENA